MNTHTSHKTATKSGGNSVVTIRNLGICLGLITISLVALFVFKVPINTLLLGGILLGCPLLHFWVIKDGNHKH